VADGGTTVVEVVAVLEALAAARCWVALEGGWGVDALADRQTRPHRDVDLDTDAARLGDVLGLLAGLGYRIETDLRPHRVELTAAGGGRVDVHPLTFDAEGNGYQAGPQGERWELPAASFVTGRILGHPVRCLSAAQQVEWHAGYEQRDSDHADLAVLRELAAHERRPAVPAPAVDRRWAGRDEVLAARAALRALAARHGMGGPRLAPSGAVVVQLSDGPEALMRFAAAAEDLVGGWVNVVVTNAPWSPDPGLTRPL
jgi:lincosamide nucleotidyltransferase A/C/D/E